MRWLIQIWSLQHLGEAFEGQAIFETNASSTVGQSTDYPPATAWLSMILSHQVGRQFVLSGKIVNCSVKSCNRLSKKERSKTCLLSIAGRL